MVHHLQSGIEAIFAPDCTVVIETAKLVKSYCGKLKCSLPNVHTYMHGCSHRYMLDLNKEQRAKYETKVTSMAKALGFKVCKTW